MCLKLNYVRLEGNVRKRNERQSMAFLYEISFEDGKSTVVYVVSNVVCTYAFLINRAVCKPKVTPASIHCTKT